MQLTLFSTPVDPTARKHHGNALSRAAFDRVADHLQRMEALVLQAIAEASDYGLTMKELAKRWDVGQNAISGRATSLLAATRIKRNGQRRDGAAVLVINDSLRG